MSIHAKKLLKYSKQHKNGRELLLADRLTTKSQEPTLDLLTSNTLETFSLR